MRDSCNGFVSAGQALLFRKHIFLGCIYGKDNPELIKEGCSPFDNI